MELEGESGRVKKQRKRKERRQSKSWSEVT